MNVCSLSGSLVSDPIPIGNNQGIRFLLKTNYPSPPGKSTASTAYVPCVVFELTSDQLKAFQSKSNREKHIELTGRVRRSSFENSDGKRTFTTEVVTNGATVLIRD